MNETLLTNLELQVETLLRDRTQLLNENGLLRKKLTVSSRERGELLDKNKNAVRRIKQIATQLRNEAPWKKNKAS